MQSEIINGEFSRSELLRREFLTVMGASIAMAGFACAKRPVHKIIPYVIRPEEIIPGVPTWYASTCRECPASCGVLIKNREGRPIKIEGNPDHPLSKGALCARGQASVLGLYDPDRLRFPLLRSRNEQQSHQAAWPDVDEKIQAKLGEIANKGGRLKILSGEITSPSTKKLIKEFLAAFRNAAHVEYEPLGHDDITEGQWLCYGNAVLPAYSFGTAQVVLSLGADFLGTWSDSMEYASDWVKGRKLDSTRAASAHLSRLICFEPVMSVTGANADERYPIRPGDEIKVALAVAYELVIRKNHPLFSKNEKLVSVLKSYRPELVADEIGLRGGTGVFSALAAELWAARGKSLVIAGGIQSRTKDSLSLQVAVNLLNSVLSNEGTVVDGRRKYKRRKYKTRSSNTTSLINLISEMKAGQVDALIIYRSNPAYTLPQGVSGFDEAVSRVPLVIAVSEYEDETAKLADYVLPDHHYLENWGDSSQGNGVLSLQQPAMAPLHSSRAFEDTLLTWISGAKLNDWHHYLKANWQESVYAGQKAKLGADNSFERFWENSLRKGALTLGELGAPQPRDFIFDSIKQLPHYSRVTDGMALSLYAKVSMFDGRNANNAWLQELPDPVSSATWDNYLNIAPLAAEKLGLSENDVMEVSSGKVSAELPIHIQPGMHPNAVSIAVGYGRRAAGKVGTLAGIDAYQFMKIEGGKLVCSGQRVSLRKTGRTYELARTQWHTSTENRPVINEISFDEYKKNPAAANHTDPHLRLDKIPTMWPAVEYKGHKWGMAIDLNACIGCGACAIGCQAENNIPVVGRQQVRNNRHMHWIRIDRYYQEKSGVVFQPMLCQQCENAPCETVCPVQATVHDDEGINAQVYNRCVGTRYCQNNCPYKVRRFNFFDHWKSYGEPMNMVWNPDVTVRTRGIMEKCTFCIQRIREAKEKAKDSGMKVKDGDIKPACQQSCPTGAIVFGDLNDPNSMVSKLVSDARAYRVLEMLNAKPSISYLTKVRNKSRAGG
ncbi:MAG: 4Fe-4S dicluster domain-containing protein [Bdellovibrionota bacterium]